MTLNLAHGRKDSFNQMLLTQASIKKNLSDIADVLLQQKADIIALQEADDRSRWSGNFNHVQWLAQQAHYPAFFQTNHESNWFFSYGTAILSQWAFTETLHHTFQPSPPTLNKGFTLAQIAWQYDKLKKPLLLDIVSLHLDFSRQSVRKQQISEIKATLNQRNHPVIIMGDFNTEWLSEAQMIKKLAEQGHYHTYRSEAQDLGTYKAGKKRLDWILISQELEFKNLKVLPDLLSDHSAIVAEITVKETP